MDIEIRYTTTSPDTTSHLDGLHAAAKEAWDDWQAAAQHPDEEEYEAGRIAYENAYEELQTALGEAWDLPHPELDAP